MKARNLEFYKAVESTKTHYIFTQDEIFYVFTKMDEDTRGNFFIIHQSEVEETEKQIADKYLRQFHPRELDKYDFNIDKDYRVQRIRNVCYILKAKGKLEIEKVGREILFENIGLFKAENSQTNIVRNSQTSISKLIQSESPKVVCPFCNNSVLKKNIKKHKKEKCAKRPNK